MKQYTRERTPQSSNKLVFREDDTLPNGFLTMPGSKH
ncbi:hypothetical protein AE42_01648 [Enterobacter kobei]|nr:hypothetical protein AE42_01648 [Enterobacter kobei]